MRISLHPALILPLVLALEASAAPTSILPSLPETSAPKQEQGTILEKGIDLRGASANKVKAVDLLNEATSHAEEGNFADAARNLEDAILYLNDSDPQLAAALHMNLGSSYDHLGKFEQALTEFEKAAKLSPAEVEILYNEALVYVKLKRYDDAIACLNRYVAKQPDAKLQHDALAEIDRIKTLK